MRARSLRSRAESLLHDCDPIARPSIMMTFHTGTGQHSTTSADLRQRAAEMAATAAAAAEKVDFEARFPSEAFAAAKAQRLLGVLVPIELGGESASISDVADICYM